MTTTLQSTPQLDAAIAQALTLERAGQWEGAIVAAGKGLELEPREVRLLNIVGFSLIHLDRRQEAAQVFQRAMAADPSSADAHFGYGWAAELLGALPAARSAFERAIVLRPDHAHALAGLAGLAVRRRDLDAAERLALRAVASDPDQTDALTHLARIDLQRGDVRAAEGRLTRLVAHPQMAPEARADLRLLLGDALDGQGRWIDAFEAYAAGKSELAQIHSTAFAGAGRRPAAEVVDAMRAEFEATDPALWRTPASLPRDARAPTFLVGFPRSGTTLLEQVLAMHPDIEALGERPVLMDAEKEFMNRRGGITRLASILPDLLEPFRDAYWRRAESFGAKLDGRLFVDKHPFSTIRLPLINKVFPLAKVIFALRDPRDVVLSCFRRNFNMSAMMYAFTALESAVALYDAVMQAGESYRRSLDLDILVVRHEDVVADFESQSRRLCDFLGVPWTPDLARFGTSDRMLATPSGAQVARGLYAESAGQWRNYAFALAPVMERLAPWVERFGYPVE